ncbi:MAG TPA: protease complex subunit PrcB family protein [Kofleriaceae bacterium]|nr:protease complex subunit PrcB family protein [Kofleriaceae bacterium]
MKLLGHGLVLAPIATALACAAGGGTRAVMRPVPGAAAVQLTSGLHARQRIIVRDRADWRDVWTRMFHAQAEPPLPEIDFSRTVVVIAAMGDKNTGGYAIHIDDAHLLGSGAVVSITETAPAGGCWVTGGVTAPVAVVALPWFPGKVEFLEHAARAACQPPPP